MVSVLLVSPHRPHPAAKCFSTVANYTESLLIRSAGACQLAHVLADHLAAALHCALCNTLCQHTRLLYLHRQPAQPSSPPVRSAELPAGGLTCVVWARRFSSR